MFNILVVDDEKIHKKGLVSLLEKICPDDMIWEASDGVEALEILENVPCEIIISDIRMAKMDGISLLRKVKERKPETFFIILSGYAEFSYAKDALTLQASEYLLKPVKSEELKRAVQDAQKKLQGSKKKQKQVADMEERLKEAVPVYMEWLLNQFISRPAFKEKEHLETLLPLKQQGYILLTRVGAAHQDLDEEVSRDIGYQIRKSLAPDSSLSFSVQNLNNTLATLVLSAQAPEEAVLQRLQEQLLQRGYQDVYFAVSSIQENLYQSGKTVFDEAYGILSYAFYEKEHILRSGPGNRERAGTEIVLDENKLIEAMWEREPLKAQLIYEKLIMQAVEERWVAPEVFKRKVVFLFYRILRSLEPLIEKAAMSNLNEMDQRLMEAADLHTLLQNGKRLIFYIAKAMNINGQQELTPMQKCCEYLERHYMEEISMETVAKQFHFNPSYFSTLFKNNLGISFSGYLSDLRMKKALELLLNSEYKVRDIAGSVGYKDANYFIRAFKKRFGRTPDEMRKGGC